MFDVEILKTQNLSSISKIRQGRRGLGEMNCPRGNAMYDVEIKNPALIYGQDFLFISFGRKENYLIFTVTFFVTVFDLYFFVPFAVIFILIL